VPARPSIIALEGPSGAGKTTVARAAHRTFGWDLLPEAYDRLDPAPSLTFSSPSTLLALEGRLVTEERRRYREARALRWHGRSVVADTGFLGPLTYTAGLVALGLAPRRVLERLVASARRSEGAGPLGVPDATVYLDVPGPVLRARLAHDPVGHPAALVRRHRAVGRFERRLYVERFPAIAPGRIAVVPGLGRPEVVAARVRAAVRHLARVENRRGLRDLWIDQIRTFAAAAARARAESAATVKKPARSARAPSR
jgi:hypothetical protein